MIPAPTHPLHLVLGLVAWCAWFVALYGGLSVGCAVAPPDVEQGPLTWINGMLLVLTLGGAALLGHWARGCWRGRASAGDDRAGRFIVHVGAAVHLLSAVAVLLVGLPALALPPCV